jgi:DNA-directed RNA polymerase alpha subunit
MRIRNDTLENKNTNIMAVNRERKLLFDLRQTEGKLRFCQSSSRTVDSIMTDSDFVILRDTPNTPIKKIQYRITV